MDSFLLNIFETEIADQCDFALSAFYGMEYTLSTRDNLFWLYVEAFLSHTAKVSKLLWTSDLNERVDLRRSLGINDNSPIRDRKLRNHFEHFDTRVEDWARESPNKIFVGRVIADDLEHAVGGVQPKDIIRAYETKTKILVFRGETYDLKPLLEALKALQVIARKEASIPFWKKGNHTT